MINFMITTTIATIITTIITTITTINIKILGLWGFRVLDEAHTSWR
jgi:hypothetical protein